MLMTFTPFKTNYILKNHIKCSIETCSPFVNSVADVSNSQVVKATIVAKESNRSTAIFYLFIYLYLKPFQKTIITSYQQYKHVN